MIRRMKTPELNETQVRCSTAALWLMQPRFRIEILARKSQRIVVEGLLRDDSLAEGLVGGFPNNALACVRHLLRRAQVIDMEEGQVMA